MERLFIELAPLKGNDIGQFLTIHGSTYNATCISGTLPTGVKIFDLWVLVAFGIPWDPYWGGSPAFGAYYNGIIGIISLHFFAKCLEAGL